MQDEQIDNRDAALARLTAWWNDPRWVPEVLEVAGGGPRSGRTAVLQGLAAEVPEAVVVDATGLTAEKLRDEICRRCDIPWEAALSGEWRAQTDRTTPRFLVLVVNAHRAGRTRRSSHPRRILEDHLDDIAGRGRLGVVVEIDDVRDYLSKNRVRLVLTSGEEAADSAEHPFGAPEIRSLALAEPRTVPLSVWRKLVELHTDAPCSEEQLTAVAGQFPNVVTVTNGVARFVDEATADRIRLTVSADDVAPVHRGIVHWLRERLRQSSPADWQTAGPLGQYAACGLAMHAANAELLHDVLDDGHLLANIPQDALLDAASCPRGRVPAETPAADAYYAHLNGITPSDQRTWASWLHLMALARGKTDLARNIHRARPDLPWKAVWAHWRPPGGWNESFIQPGPLGGLIATRLADRPVVVAFSRYDDIAWLWDADTGEELFGSPLGQLPSELAETVNLTEIDSTAHPPPMNLARRHAIAHSYRDVEDDVFHCGVAIGNTLVLSGQGGVAALHSRESSEPPHIEPPRRPELVWPYRAPARPNPNTVVHTDHDSLQRLFGPADVHRLPADDLPPALDNPAARHVLCYIGLPIAEIGALGLSLREFAKNGLQPIEWPASDAPPTPGPFFLIGSWWGGRIVIDASNGTVLRAPAPDEPEGWSSTPLVASDLLALVRMIHFFGLGCFLRTMSACREEVGEIRSHIRWGVRAIDKPGSRSPAWTRAFEEDITGYL